MTDERVAACPECDHSHVETRHADPRGSLGADCAAYRCRECGATFDDPAKRDAKQTGPPRGLAGDLLAADARDAR